jgi:hypothetical protein
MQARQSAVGSVPRGVAGRSRIVTDRKGIHGVRWYAVPAPLLTRP